MKVKIILLYMNTYINGMADTLVVIRKRKPRIIDLSNMFKLVIGTTY
jgi:hypothetical protein